MQMIIIMILGRRPAVRPAAAGRRQHIYIYIHIHTYTCTYIYIYIYTPGRRHAVRPAAERVAAVLGSSQRGV